MKINFPFSGRDSPLSGFNMSMSMQSSSHVNTRKCVFFRHVDGFKVQKANSVNANLACSKMDSELESFTTHPCRHQSKSQNHKFNMMCFPISFQTVQAALVQMNI